MMFIFDPVLQKHVRIRPLFFVFVLCFLITVKSGYYSRHVLHILFKFLSLKICNKFEFDNNVYIFIQNNVAVQVLHTHLFWGPFTYFVPFYRVSHFLNKFIQDHFLPQWIITAEFLLWVVTSLFEMKKLEVYFKILKEMCNIVGLITRLCLRIIKNFF